MSGNYIHNGQIFNSDGMVVGNAPSKNGIPAAGSTPTTDPNYNPGFFGWMWDGITNPGKAWNTFENKHVVPAARAVDDFLSPVTDPVAEFLVGNPVGRAVEPVLRTGAGYSTDRGAHVGMAAPTGPTGQIDIDGIVDRVVAKHDSAQPGLAGWKPPAFSYNGKEMTEAEYRKATTGGTLGASTTPDGWNSATQSPPRKGVSSLGDGTEYTVEIRDGQTIYNVVASQKNPGAVGKRLDSSNFDRMLSGKSFTPIAAPATPPASAGQPSPLTGGQNPAAPGGIDPVTGMVIGGVVSAGSSAAAGTTQANAATEAGRLQKESTDAILKMLQEQYNQQRTDQTPWREAGVGALDKLKTFETDNPAFGIPQFEQDPGYTFRLNEGMKALQNSAAARGGLLSGNTLRGISDYGQASASQEYQNAFNRYNTQRTSNLNRLQSLAGVGQTAVGQTQQAGQNYMSGAGNMMTGGANALAGGVRGSADARASSYMGAGNALIGAIGNYQSHNFLNNILGGR